MTFKNNEILSNSLPTLFEVVQPIEVASQTYQPIIEVDNQEPTPIPNPVPLDPSLPSQASPELKGKTNMKMPMLISVLILAFWVLGCDSQAENASQPETAAQQREAQEQRLREAEERELRLEEQDLQDEAKNAVGAVMRQQQAHRLEHGAFATDFEELKIGLPTQTDNYEYTIEDGDDETWVFATPIEDQANVLLAYVGGVFVTETGQTAGACQGTAPNETPAVAEGGDQGTECTTGERMK